jgi:hypothetical protein
MFATDISESYNKNLPNSYIEMYNREKKFEKIKEKINYKVI